jgi:hypothetical protein
MTDAINVTPGARVGHWRVLGLDGHRRATCQCRCGNIRVLAVDALASGASTSCGCAPPTAEAARKARVEAEQHRRVRELNLKNWRPSRDRYHDDR